MADFFTKPNDFHSVYTNPLANDPRFMTAAERLHAAGDVRGGLEDYGGFADDEGTDNESLDYSTDTDNPRDE